MSKHRAQRRKRGPNLPDGFARRAMAGSVCVAVTGAGVVSATTVETSQAEAPTRMDPPTQPVVLDPPAAVPVEVQPVAGFEDPATLEDSSGAAQYVPPRVGTVRRQAIDEIPAAALMAYQRAETVINAARPQCHLDWSVLAAVGRVESDHGRDGGGALGTGGTARPALYGVTLDGKAGRQKVRDTDAGALDGVGRWDRTMGPLNFLPTTWTVVGVDSDGDGRRNPQDIDDAALAAAVVLCGQGHDLAKPDGLTRALRDLNPADGYARAVMTLAESYTSDLETVPQVVPVGLPTTKTEPGLTAAVARVTRQAEYRGRHRRPQHAATLELAPVRTSQPPRHLDAPPVTPPVAPPVTPVEEPVVEPVEEPVEPVEVPVEQPEPPVVEPVEPPVENPVEDCTGEPGVPAQPVEDCAGLPADASALPVEN